MFQPVASVRLRWLTPAEGGRPKPPSGPVYAATAHFENETNYFSVVLTFGDTTSHNGLLTGVELTLLAPDKLPDIVAKLVPSCCLVITEGPRPVAECEILTVQKKEFNPGKSRLVS